jgi:putative transcriptional regulator
MRNTSLALDGGPAPVPTHHPPAEMLLDYATGAAGEAQALIIATHLTFCPACRAEVARLEALGGTILDDADPAGLDDGSLDAVLAAIASEAASAPAAVRIAPAPAGAVAIAETVAPIPAPLRAYIGDDFAALPWKRVLKGIYEVRLPLWREPIRVRLLLARSGCALPQHGHRGNEMLLVLQGAFRDARGRVGRGDLDWCDEEVEHQPVVESGMDCICLSVTDAPLRLTGPVGRWFDPLVRFKLVKF